MTHGVANNNVYWTDETERAVTAYNLESDPERREIIYNESLHEPIRRLCEAFLKSFNNTEYINETDEDLIAELQSHIVKECIPKIKPNKGKAFSYFTVACRFYLIRRNKGAHKECLRYSPSEIETEDGGYELELISNTDSGSVLEDLEYQQLFLNFWEGNIQRLFPKHHRWLWEKVINVDIDKCKPIARNRAFTILYNTIQKDFPNVSLQIAQHVFSRFKKCSALLYEHYLEHGSFEGIEWAKAESNWTCNNITWSDEIIAIEKPAVKPVLPRRFRKPIPNDPNKFGPKLTLEQREEIIKKYVPRKYSLYRLAKEYNVSPQAIFSVVKNAKQQSVDCVG